MLAARAPQICVKCDFWYFEESTSSIQNVHQALHPCLDRDCRRLQRDQPLAPAGEQGAFSKPAGLRAQDEVSLR